MMPKKVTVSDLVTIIQEAGKPVTESEIADGAGVSRPTVANRREELEEHDGVEKGKVAGVHTYWAARIEGDQEDGGDPPAAESTDAASEDDGGKGVLGRLFGAVPAFGSPVAVWALFGLTFALGLTVGVSLFLLVAQPPVVVAIAAVSIVLAVGLVVTLPVALYYLVNPTRARVEVDGETA